MKKKKELLSKDLRGFSLPEMLISGGILAFVFAAGVYYFKEKRQDIDRTKARVENLAVGLIFEQYVTQDIQGLTPSFRGMKLADDNGSNFYDHIFDQTCAGRCERIFTLKPGGKPFIMLTKDRTIPDTNYSPKTAYSPDGKKGPFLNRKNNLVKKAQERGTKSLWPTAGNYSLIYAGSDIPVRKNAKDYPKFISFLGWARGQSRKLKRETVGGLFNIRDPRDNRYITSLKSALERIPYTEGLDGNIRLSAVQIVRYRIQWQEIGNKKHGVVYRGVKNPPGQGDENQKEFDEKIVGTGVNEIVFTRNNIQFPSVHTKIVFDK